MLFGTILYHLEHVEHFQTIKPFLELFGTIWDMFRTFGNIWGHFGPFWTILDHLGLLVLFSDGKNLQNSTGTTLSLKNTTQIMCKKRSKPCKTEKNAKNYTKNAKNF